ncbi:MAG TPA: PadR family transcriptional regulator [Candidatus Nanoarchaeia archaeon]|nr:PadR family transcriptional regulator [Candidatus Nanoarchaeia archaeon]
MKSSGLISLKGLLAFQILHLLHKKECCGDDLANLIGNKKGSKLTPGTIYPALKFLRRKKLIAYRKNGRKKLYSLTKAGKKEYRNVHTTFVSIFKPLLKISKK